jgi:hypothetical protein
LAATSDDLDTPSDDDPSQSEDRRSEQGKSLAATQVSIIAASQAYRGSQLSVRGTVRSTSGNAGALEVQIILAISGGSRVLGRAVTQPDGRFSVDLDLPGDLQLGNYRLVARVRGDDTRRGCASGRYDAVVSP